MWHRFLTKSERQRVISSSALDLAWLDQIPADRPTLIQAAGVLMFFTKADVRQLITALAARFAGGVMQFDVISR